MFEAHPYFDYCIQKQCVENNYEKTVKLLFDLGYRTIAINHYVDDTNLINNNNPSKKKKKGGSDLPSNIPIPEPFKIKPVKGAEKMLILNRLTVSFSHQEFIYKIKKNPIYKKYDIIAAQPTTVDALSYTCNTFDAHILTFNPENKFNLKLHRKTYNQLLDHNYHFEILYSPCIEDSTKRKNTIHLAHLYRSFGKSKNIIISSGAKRPIMIRSPYDIINLGLIFGLSESQSKNAISYLGNKVYLYAVGKKHGKSAIVVTEESSKEDEEKNENDDSVVLLDTDYEEMETNQPALKKLKQ